MGKRKMSSMEREIEYQKWYLKHAVNLGLDPDPDDPAHKYDYRSAYEAGMGPDKSGHWPSIFKDADHPRRFIDGIDTRKR